MKEDEFINNDESQQRNVYGSSIDSVCNTICLRQAAEKFSHMY